MSLAFHVAIHPRSADVGPGPAIVFDGGEFSTLRPSSADLGEAFSRSFEEVHDGLTKLPRTFIEPDGSFVWVSSPGEPSWQLDGMLYDRDERLLYIELKGACTAERLDQLLALLGWPQTPVMFQLLREAVFLSEAEFRRYTGCINQNKLTS
ncbi:MAG TPA: hypothetical protein VJ783_10550 [Pirellulales bacterium]|nr:hypothetical protein [Pirellulales bacterium]